MPSGSTLATFGLMDAEPPPTNYATNDERNAHRVLDYDDTTDESTFFTGILPRHYTGGGITLYVHYSMTTAITGKIRIDGSFERIGDGVQDVDADGFASAQSVNVAAVPGTAGHVDIVSIAFTDGAQLDSIAVGEMYRIKLERKPSDTTNDTAVGDMELHAIELKET